MDTASAVIAAAFGMWVLEQWRPGQPLPDSRHWWSRLLLLNLVQLAVALLGARTWDHALAGAPKLLQIDYGLLPDALLGYLLITFVFYWWHRARHQSPWLWRTFHAVHHSASRIEVLTSFYKHPLEILANGLLTSLLLVSVLGLQPASVALALSFAGLAELFYHWNVRTPHWLGYLIQRPESHRRHHQRDWHRDNYSDLPLWDWLFGTLDNPRESPRECGFADDRERQLGRLLLWRTPR